MSGVRISLPRPFLHFARNALQTIPLMLYKSASTLVIVYLLLMSSVASVVQYPLPCPECKNYTSQPAEKLRIDRKSTCRVCGNIIRLTDQQLESLERTLSHMSGCGLRGGQAEEIPEEIEEEAFAP